MAVTSIDIDPECTITMQRQRSAFDRISQRQFDPEQIDAPVIAYPA